ncbi:permease [Wukongibacter sp. M2B1]|uniref:permease n=1 Tax=Wukongibacter sp. M2B1 TaxID=3088895 RepID=UPI003D7B8015
MISKPIMNKVENVIIFLLGILVIIFFLNMVIKFEGDPLSIIQKDYLEGFTIVFLSIILEAIPFVMIGTFISSIIQIFVSEKTIAKIIPKNRFVGLIAASLMGIIFPVCECAIVPIMRRLIKKGVPLHIAVTFMLAVPIVNPVVLASTYYAFSGQTYIVFLRGFLGLMSAILIGHIIGMIQGKNNPLRNNTLHEHIGCGCGHEHAHHHHEHNHEHDSCGIEQHHHSVSIGKRGVFSTIIDIIEHTSLELYDVGKFLIIGAFLSALMQTFVSRSYIVSIGQGKVLSTIVMMVLAFVLSLCSEADAFIARTFVGQFTTGSIVGFLILGPMTDIKNTLMLSGSFKMKFVVKLITIISLVCFIMAMLVNLIGI